MNSAVNVIDLLRESLRRSDDGLLLEVLAREVAKSLGRPVAPSRLEELLVRNPDSFVADGGGRWRLRARMRESLGEVISAAKRTALQRGRFVVFDLETLGKEAEGEETEIIEIALARYENGCRVETWQTYVQPSTPIPPQITELTTIRDEDVAGAPGQQEALLAFFARVDGYPLIAHNGLEFDGAVLRSVSARVGLPLPSDFLMLDTLPLARLFHQRPGQRHTNEDLALLYGCHQEGAHRADVDVDMLCGVVEGLLQETNRHPLGPLLFELLRRADDPWADLLQPPRPPVNLDACLARLGEARAPLLSARAAPEGPGCEDGAIDALFVEMTRLGRDRREPQMRFAQLAGEALRSGRIAVVSAGTGTGKGLGYLVPAVLQARAEAKPVVVSTYTKILQSQLLEKDLTFLAELLPGLRAAVLKGRANYLSLARLREELQDALDEERLSPARAWTLGTLASLALTSPDGDLEPIWPSVSGIDRLHDGAGEAWAAASNVRASAEGGQQERSPDDRPDFYAAARRNAQRADILVVNHSLLLTQAESSGDRQPELLSPFIVCDEAHNLEDAATSVLKRELGEITLRRLLQAVRGRATGGGLLGTARRAGLPADDETLVAAVDAVEDATTHMENLGQRLRAFVEANTVTSREDRKRYGATVELRPSSLQAAGGPALRDSSMALLQALERLQTALQRDSRRIASSRTCHAPSALARVRPRRSRANSALVLGIRGGDDPRAHGRA